LKTFSLSDVGEEQLTGFHLPSELVGLSGMDTEKHPVSAQRWKPRRSAKFPSNASTNWPCNCRSCAVS
jgi:CRP/FNR family transcriptional regulator